MTKKIKLHAIKLVFVVVLVLLLIQSQISIVKGTEETLQVHKWVLTKWHEKNLLYWYPLAYVNATVNSEVWYNVSFIDFSNITHPTKGKFSLGNLTYENADTYEIGAALILSIYPWSPGVATHTNWTWHKSEAIRASSEGFLRGSLVISEDIPYKINEYQRKAIKFSYQQNTTLGNQNTTLIYDIESGILLYGYSEIFFDSLYVIELYLAISSLINANNTTIASISWVASYSGIPLLFLLILIARGRKIG
jgi:hypothetical protein